MVFLWFSYGFSYGFPMFFLWFSYVFPMFHPWSAGKNGCQQCAEGLPRRNPRPAAENGENLKDHHEHAYMHGYVYIYIYKYI